MAVTTFCAPTFLLIFGCLLSSKLAFQRFHLLLLCGDNSANPGPQWKFPCSVCTKPDKSNEQGICCDQCDQWLHTRCCGMNKLTYDNLANSSCVWICPACESANYTSTVLSSTPTLSISNTYSALNLNWRLCFKFWTKWGYVIAGQPCAKLDTLTSHVTKAVLSTNHEKVPSQTKSHGNKLQQHQRQWKGSCFCSSCRSTQSWYYLRMWV